MNPSEFIHPQDEAALRQLEAIPGFTVIVKKILELGLETMQYGLNMAQSIRLSERQLPELYKHLLPICEKLDIAEPEFYLKMDPYPNAWTFGDTRLYITVTSGLLEMMNDSELDAVLAHECGHILCHHSLYHTIATIVLNCAGSIGMLDSLTAPLQYALWYWMRKSELSCDRVASVITSPNIVASVMARFAGGPRIITEKINIREWAVQADEYDSIYNDGVWNKTLQIINTLDKDHPFAAVRVREILKWEGTEQYKRLKQSISNSKDNENPRCPFCNHMIEPGWLFCTHCGHSIK